MGKKSITQFYQAPVRYLSEMDARESEFEKPYVDEEYRKMHFDFPWPDFPPFPEIPPWPPLPPFDGPVPGLPGCVIVCYPPHNDCDNPVWCHPSIWCGTDIGCTLCSWVVEGAVKGYTPHASGVGSWGIDIWLDDELLEEDGETALVSVCMTDPCGNVCCEDIEVTCKICPPEISISWDTAVETIGQSSSLVVAVKDGLGPYKWEVTGTGFSMRYPETVGTGNILDSDGSACGTATITVTDYCEDTATGYVRCTAASHWVAKTWGVCEFSGPAVWQSDAGSSAIFYATKGIGKQQETILYRAGQSPGVTCGVNDICDNYCADGYHCLGSPFIHSVRGDITPNCYQVEPGHIWCYCGHINLIYYEWECI